MSAFLDTHARVMDLGCGEQWLRNYLPEESEYVPVDYKKRSDDTFIADFNKRQFPPIKVEDIFVSGCLEYINDPEWFIDNICSHALKKVILSYCTTNTHPDIIKRKELFWKNHLSKEEVIRHFEQHGFELQQSNIHDNNTIFIFVPCQK